MCYDVSFLFHRLSAISSPNRLLFLIFFLSSYSSMLLNFFFHVFCFSFITSCINITFGLYKSSSLSHSNFHSPHLLIFSPNSCSLLMINYPFHLSFLVHYILSTFLSYILVPLIFCLIYLFRALVIHLNSSFVLFSSIFLSSSFFVSPSIFLFSSSNFLFTFFLLIFSSFIFPFLFFPTSSHLFSNISSHQFPPLHFYHFLLDPSPTNLLDHIFHSFQILPGVSFSGEILKPTQFRIGKCAIINRRKAINISEQLVIDPPPYSTSNEATTVQCTHCLMSLLLRCKFNQSLLPLS